MSSRLARIPLISYIAVAVATAAQGQTVVYDNSTNYLGTEHPIFVQLGNEITLAGNERIITSISLGVRPVEDAPATFNARVTFTMNDGHFGNSPGTFLWASDVHAFTIDGDAPTFIEFDVPNVRVPDTFIWILTKSGSPVDPANFYPPEVGSARRGYWAASSGPTPWFWREVDGPFGARVTAAPEVMLDIDPGACPNVLNIGRSGPIKMAILGAPAFEVWELNLTSLALSRADGVGGTVQPIQRGRGRGIRFKDVATPFSGAPCECHDLHGDGIVDRVLTFSVREMVNAFELGALKPGMTVTLTLTGRLIDGTEFAASDCVVVNRRGRP